MYKRRNRMRIWITVGLAAGLMITACGLKEGSSEVKNNSDPGSAITETETTAAPDSTSDVSGDLESTLTPARSTETMDTTQDLTAKGDYQLKTCGIIKTREDIYDLSKQKQVHDKLESWKKEKHTFANPLLVMNPFGTNTTGLYVYFTTDKKTSVSYKITTGSGSVFERTASGTGKKHEFTLAGMIPGKKNTIEITLMDKEGKALQTGSFTLKAPALTAEKPPKITVTKGESTEELADGLYAFMGHDKNVASNVYLSDNEGNIRGEIPLLQYRADQLLFLEEGMCFSYSYYDLAVMNSLGEIVKTYSLGDYKMHHDYIYDDKNNSLLVLVNKKGSDTIEDVVVSVNLKTGAVKELMDFSQMLPEMVEKCVPPEGGNTYGGDELDWFHSNSLSIIHGTDLIVSSRELNSLICVKNYRTKPKLDYIICDNSLWKGTSYESLVLKKKGDFTAQSGQHTIQFLEDVNKNSYYLIMYNNNYTRSRTRPDWENAGFPAYKNTGKYKDDPDASHYYKYLVNRKKGTYKLVEKVDLPYSSIVSSVQLLDGHLVSSSGNKSKCFNEYDADGKMIAQFTYTAGKYAYRVYKYTFENFWFASKPAGK